MGHSETRNLCTMKIVRFTASNLDVHRREKVAGGKVVGEEVTEDEVGGHVGTSKKVTG